MQIWVYRPCSADRLPKAALPGTDLASGLLQTATFIRIQFSGGSGHTNSWVYLLNMLKTITEAGTLHCKSLFFYFSHTECFSSQPSEIQKYESFIISFIFITSEYWQICRTLPLEVRLKLLQHVIDNIWRMLMIDLWCMM